jgi:hypothetical protein
MMITQGADLSFRNFDFAFDVYVDVHGKENQNPSEKARRHCGLMNLSRIEHEQSERQTKSHTTKNVNRNQKYSLFTTDACRFELDDTKNSGHHKNRGKSQNYISQHDALYVTGVHP